jgi:hypothetical protein
MKEIAEKQVSKMLDLLASNFYVDPDVLETRKEDLVNYAVNLVYDGKLKKSFQDEIWSNVHKILNVTAADMKCKGSKTRPKRVLEDWYTASGRLFNKVLNITAGLKPDSEMNVKPVYKPVNEYTISEQLDTLIELQNETLELLKTIAAR